MKENYQSKTARIAAIDVLRGFTLLGIVLVHMVEQYYAGMHPKQHADFGSHGLADQITEGFIGIFVIGKFYMIFSFLFGLSFYLQLSAKDSNSGFLIRFAWRLLILFAIGFLHSLHYRGDILTIYAVLGISLIIFYRLPDKALLIVALIFTLNFPSVVSRGVQAFLPPAAPAMTELESEKAAATYYETVKKGSYASILNANLHEFKGKYDFQVSSGRIYITLGLFLLGLYAGRKKIMLDLELYTPFFRKLIRYSLWSLLGCVVFSAMFFGSFQLFKIPLPDAVQWMVGGFVFDVFNAAMASIYSTGILLLFQKEKWKTRLMYLYPVGRMGLTTYLMQTMFGFFLFFSVGLGLLGEIGAAACFGIALLFFLVQVLFSQWWFRHFKYGLFEWIWRSLTDLKLQPFRTTDSR